MILIGDIGNTDTKICVINTKYKIIKRIIIPTNKINNSILYNKLIFYIRKKNLIRKCLFCSVVPNKFVAIKKFVKKNLKINCIELKQLDLNKIIKIKVNRKQVGSDRLANSISVMSLKNNYIILDFGTATTFDVIKNGKYQGGVIAPGVKLSMKNLIKSTALLPKINLKNNQRTYGKNTKEALNAGFVWGYEGLINNIINKIISKDKRKYKIILTGGYANFFKKVIKRKIFVDQNITVKGISKVYKEFI